MKKFKSFAAIAAVSTLALAACSGGDSEGTSADNTAKTDYKACVVSDAGGWDDKSFNESAYNGLKQAESELGISIGAAESKDDADYDPNVEAQIADNCDLIIGVGFNLAAAGTKAAEANPDISFALIDSAFTNDKGEVQNFPNARPLTFNTSEAAYLAGYVAAAQSKSGIVATFGGLPIPSVTIFMDGFVDGVAAYNTAKGKDVKVLGWDKAAQSGSFTNSFEDQALGKTLAQQFIDQGADIIMPVAGPVGLGAAAAAKADGDTLIIGVDADWYETAPDYKEIILTSVLKGIAPSVFDTIKAGVDGKFSADPYIGTLENGGVDIASFHDFDSQVSDETKKEVADLKAKIISGELKVESPSAP
ncbi:MAG: BMP family ABC transporter substrate-binding protein [Arcanobacterium sp.]|nr:BMP family ABC transporter substrate-binding protein [Arcanobacterium sp.]